MKHSLFLKSLFILACFTTLSLHAAVLTIESQDTAASNGKPLVVRVFVDPENTPLSALSGTLSFPTDIFDVGDITTQSSIVSVWVNHPQVSTEKYFDSRTRISFGGIMPGGFTGVRSPYYEGVRPGVVFTITLIPKSQGLASLLLDDIELHAYDGTGTTIPTVSFAKTVTVPVLTGTQPKTEASLTEVTSQTLSATLARDPLIESNAWYLTVSEDESVRPINHMEVAESSDYSADRIASYAWKEMSNPYVLLHQSRTKYIHVKVVYENNTYALKTIPPVENSAPFSYLSIILLCIALILFVLYRHGKYHLFAP